MTPLIALSEFEIIEGGKIKTDSSIIKEATRRMFQQNKVKEIDYEDVIDPFELMLVLNDIVNETNLKKGNKNASNGELQP